MGKKKKSTPQSKAGDGRVSLDSSKSPDPAPCFSRDAITVRLAPGSVKQRSNDFPTVWMHERDMSEIDVLNGEQVILLAHRPRENHQSETERNVDRIRNLDIIGAAVCRVEVTKTGSKSPLSPGYIQLSSASLVEMLIPGEAMTDTAIQSPSPMKHPSPSAGAHLAVSPAPTTPSTSRFSFKTGGGGDKLYSPANSVTSPSPSSKSITSTTTPRKSPSTPIWVVPFDSKLGQKLQKRLLATAESLQMQLIDESIDIKGCETILKRIILAHIVGRHVQEGERMTVSFRGRQLEVRVVSCKANVLTKLEPSMALLTLNDAVVSDDEDSDAADIEKALVGAYIGLMQVTYSTRIRLTCEKVIELDIAVKTLEQHVAGLASTLEEVRSFLMTPLKYPELFQGTLKPPRGILLYGSSGTGKTCLAKQLVAELKSDFNVDYINCVSLQSKAAVVGEAERELSRLFCRNDKATKPSLLVMDDIHLICPKRGGHSAGTDRLAATLLSLIDGVDSNKNRIVVLAITANPSWLDPALRRPGRLDTEVEVPLPDEPSTRAEILRFHVSRVGVQQAHMADSVWNDLGKLAKGFNGADCMLAVKEAVRYAILKRTPNEPLADWLPAVLTFEELRAAIRATKPSAIKSVTVEIPHVKWSDIGGMESVKSQLREVVELPVTHAASMLRLGIPAPRGILLYGPPGCSKTLMARALATEGQMNFLAVKGPELLSKWLGESERALASLFRRARMASPSIIFFDEIDSIAVKRGSSDSASSSRLLSQLLTELDGISHTAMDGKKHRVVVIGATNRPDLLDPALTRPGRIDRMIYVGVPDTESRKQIFSLTLNGRACSDEIDVDTLAEESVSGGYSGAEIVAICRDAALMALEEADDLMAETLPVVEMKHLLRSIKETKGQITPDMLAFYASFSRSRYTFGVESFSR